MHVSKRSPVTAPAVLRNPKNSLDPLCFIFFRGESVLGNRGKLYGGAHCARRGLVFFVRARIRKPFRDAAMQVGRSVGAQMRGFFRSAAYYALCILGKARTKWPSNPGRVTRPSHSGLRHRSPCAGNLELQRFSSAWAFLVPRWLHAFRSYIGFVSPRGQLRYYGIRGCLTTKRNYIQRRSQKGVYVAKFGATIAVATVTGF